MHEGFIRQIVQAQARQIDKVLHQFQRIEARQALEGLHHPAEFLHDPLQPFAGDTWCVFVDEQVGIFQCRLGQVFFQRLIILEVLFLLALLDLVERRLSDIDVTTLNQ